MRVLLAAAASPAGGRRTRCSTSAPASAWSAWRWRGALPMREVTLVERDPRLAELARSNIERNDLVRPGAPHRGRRGPAPGRAAGARPALAESFDHVLANPPFHTQGRGTRGRAIAIKAARQCHAGGRPRSLGRASWRRMAAPGRHRHRHPQAEALPALLAGAAPAASAALSFCPSIRATGEPATRVLVQGIKGSRAPLELRPGLILHNDGQQLPARDRSDFAARGGSGL